MANHKRKRPRNRRGGCKLCKYWKVNGYRTERAGALDAVEVAERSVGAL